MDVLTLTLKLLAVYMVVSGMFLMFKQKSVPMLLKDFFDHPATVYLTGIILVFLSSMYLIQYNVWDATYRTAVTVLAWVVMAKGLAYIFFPKFLNGVVVRKSKNLFGAYGLLSFLVGLYLFFLN